MMRNAFSPGGDQITASFLRGMAASQEYPTNALASTLPVSAGNAFAGYSMPQQADVSNAFADRYGSSDIGGRLMGDLMRDFGLTPAQAAGVVGNLSHESGGFSTLQEVKPTIEGSRGGYGYAQWTGPRRRAFEAWAQAQGLDPSSYEANYGYLKHELTGTPEGRVLGSLRSAQSADQAAMIFSDQFLRPGIPHMDRRVALARQYAG